MKQTSPAATEPPSALIDAKIASLGDRRRPMPSRLPAPIRDALTDVVVERKCSTPVRYRQRLVCTGETCMKVVKIAFPEGAPLADPSGLFNASLEGKVRRAIDFREGDESDANALKALVRAAAQLNQALPRAQ